MPVFQRSYSGVEHKYDEWENEQGQIHRENGPAIIGGNGYKAWHINGKRHRLDGPAREWTHVDADEWYINDFKIKIY
jgi:hypothetical protein